MQRTQESWAIANMTARCALYMGATKIFESPWVRPRLLIRKFLMGICFRSILWLCVQNLKFVHLPVPQIIGGIQRDPAGCIRPRSLFSKILMTLCWDRPCECTAQIWSSRDNSNYCSFGVGLRTPNLREEEAVGGRGRYRSKESWWVPIGPP